MIKTPNRDSHGVTARGVPLRRRTLGGAMAERGGGVPRADIVLPGHDGTTCAPAFTAFVRGVGLACTLKTAPVTVNTSP
jgi:hypothetical protein